MIKKYTFEKKTTSNYNLFSFFLVLLFSVLFASQNAYSQGDCSVNAGLNRTICENTPLTLVGVVGGATVSSKWTQVSGPSVVIENPTVLTTNVLGAVGGNVYTFRLASICDNGVSSQDVVITVNKITTATTGANIMGCPGTYALSGNAPLNAGETGLWTIDAGGTSGVTIAASSSPTSAITFPTGSVGTSTLRWTITGPGATATRCTSQAIMTVTNYGGVVIANAGADQNLSACYDAKQGANLNASMGGNGTGTQIGTWGFVSGPSVPVISNVNSPTSGISNLVEGSYVFRWTVKGPCAQGSDTVTINVPSATQGITNAVATNNTQNFCVGVTQTLLQGNVPLRAGETVEWKKITGPAGAIIVDPNSSTTQVTGLDGSSNYTFRYTIKGGAANPLCTSISDVNIRYYSVPVISLNGGVNVLSLAENMTSGTVSIVTSGGNANTAQLISSPSGTSPVFSISGSNLNFSNLTKAGTYTFRVRRYTNGQIKTSCNEAFDDVNIIVSISPSGANAGTSLALNCGVTSGTLSGNVPDATKGQVGRWSQISGPSTTTFSNVSSINPVISDLLPGIYTYRWTISGGLSGVDSFSDVSITVSAPPTSTITPNNINSCAGNILLLTGNELVDGTTGLWQFVSGPNNPTFTDPTKTKTNVTGLLPSSTYVFSWTVTSKNPSNIASCGPSTANVTINTGADEAPSIANAGADACFPLATNSVTLGASAPTIGTGVWSFISGPSTPTFTNPALPNTTVTGLVNGVYEFEWKTLNLPCGNPSTDRVTITVAADPTSNAGSDQNAICGSTITMAANVPATGLTGTWIQISGNGGWSVDNINSPTAVFSNLTEGSYEFQWKVAKGSCTSTTDNVTFKIQLPPTAANAGSDQTICGGTTATLAALPVTQGIGTWSVISGPNNPTITTANGNASTVTGLVTGTYTLRWTTSSGGICPESNDEMVLNVSAPVSVVSPQNLCAATSVLLEGNTGSSGVWTLSSSTGGTAPIISAIGPNSASATITPGFDYTFTYTTASFAGCLAGSANVVITNSAVPATPDAGPDQSICTSGGNTVTMAATGTPGKWVRVSGPNTPTISSVSDTNAVFSGLIEGLYVYQWTTSNGSCTNLNDVVRIYVYDPPSTANAGADQTSCQLATQLNAAVPSRGIGKWTLTSDPSNGGIIIDSPNDPKSKLTIANPYLLPIGTYTFTWTVTNGPLPYVCDTSTDTVDINFSAVPPTPANAGPDQTLCAVTSVTMNANNINPGVGTWTQVSGPSTGVFSDKFSPQATVTGLVSGDYEFKWTSSNTGGGCQLDDTVKVTISPAVANVNAGPDQFLGEYSTVTMAALNPAPNVGVWSIVSGPNTPLILNVNSPTTQIAGTIPGTYVLRYTVANGICAEQADDVVIVLTGQTDLSLLKTANSSTPAVGSTVTFTVAVKNNGSRNATGVAVNDILPSGFTLVPGTVSNSGIVNAGNNSITWSGLSIANGTTLNLTYQVKVNATNNVLNEYRNTAQITASDQIDPDSTPNNNVASEDDQSSVTIVPTPTVDLAITKTADKTAPLVGSDIIFTIEVKNNGPSNATGVTVTDVIPSGYTYKSSSTASGTINTSSPATTGLVWSIGNLAKDATVTMSITATVKATGSYTNSATVVSTATDSNTSNNQSSTSPTPVAVADLSVTKIINTTVAPTYRVGSTVTFDVTVANAGPSAATGVNVVDYLPSGYTYVSHTSTGTTYNDTNGSWNVGTINSGASKLLSIVARINATGDYRNIAQVTGSNQIDPDSTPGNNNSAEDDQAQAIVTPVQVADLSLSKTVDVAAPRVGDNVKFTIALNNAGPSDAKAVKVNDKLPIGYTFVSYTSTSGTYDSGSGDWILSGNVLNGRTEYLEIVAKVNATTGVANEYRNNAQVTETAIGQIDPDSLPNDGIGDDFSTISTVPTPLIDLSLTQSIDNITPVVGSNVVFTITVANDGPSTATGIQVTDVLPSGYTFVSATPSATYDGTIWTIPSIVKGGSATLTINATVNATGVYKNVAEVTDANETDVDSTPNNNLLAEDDQDEVTISKVPLIGLSLDKIVDVAAPNVGDNVVFTITVTNAGPSAATGVVVTDKLPTGYAFVSATPSGAYDDVSGSWTIGNLAGSGTAATATLSITAKVLPTGNYNNIAEVTGANEVDNNSTPGNNDATEDDQKKVIVEPKEIADLSVVKTVDVVSPVVGSNVVFTINVTNAGPSAATGVVISDLLKGGYEFVSAIPTAGMYNRTTGLWTVSRPIAAGTTETIQITAKVLASGDYSNTTAVSASTQTDPDTTNNSSTINTIPSAVVDLVVVKRINNATPDVGSKVVFTIEVKNNGPSDATNVVVNDPLLSGYSWFSDTSAGAYDNTTGVWTIGTLANGATTTLNITATVNAAGDYSNTATATSLEPESTPVNNTTTISSTPRAVADLSLTKAVVNAAPNVGDNAVFNLVVTNAGPSDATGVVVTDLLPSGYSYVSSTPSVGSTYTSTSGAWVIGSIGIGANATLSITAKVLGTGNYTNVAQVTGSNQFDPDSTPANNNPAEDDQAQVIVKPVNEANLVTVKTVSAVNVAGISASNPNEGDTVKFSIVVTNNGGPTNATGVHLTDIIPAGVTYVSHTTSSGIYNYASGNWTIGNLNVNSTATLEITVKVNVGTKGTTITNNTTAATGDQTDPNTTGDDLTEAITVSLPPVANNDGNSGNTPNVASMPINILGNDTLQDGTQATPANTIVDLDPSTPGVDNSLLVPGEGTWNYNPATGILVFNPITGFTADPKPLVYQLTETATELSDTATVTVDYDIRKPLTFNDLSSGNAVNTAVTVNPNPGTAGQDYDPDGSIIAATVSLVVPAGATTVVTDSNGDVTSFEVPGEGKWSVNPVSGLITFTPLTTFHKDPTPVQYNVEDNDGNQSDNATVTIDYVPVATKDDSLANTSGSPVVVNVLTNDLTGDTVDPTTVSIVGETSPGVKVVVGQGTWTASPITGAITFAPCTTVSLPNCPVIFTANPTDITYTVKDVEGNVSNAVAVHVEYTPVPPVAVDDSSLNNNAGSVTIANITAANGGLADSDSDGVLDVATINLKAPVGALNVQTVTVGGVVYVIGFEVPGQGSWSLTPAGAVTFMPNSGYTASPTPIKYTIKDNDGNVSNEATITITYKVVLPVAENDLSSANPQGPVTLNPIPGTAGQDYDSDGSIIASTVSLVVPAGATTVVTDSNGDVTSFVVPGEGTWSVNPVSGLITFTPLATVHKDPTPVQYNVEDNDGNQSNNATVTIDYVPVATNDKNNVAGTAGLPVVLNVITNDISGDLVNVSTVVLNASSVGGVQVSPNEVTLSGVGKWVADASGNVTFTPVAAYTLDPPVLSYTVKDDEGNSSNAATITIDYAPVSLPDTVVGQLINTPVVVNVIANDTTGDLVDPTTVSLVNPGNATNIVTDANGDITSLVIPGEGTWNVDLVTGSVTFTPNPGFITNPTPINYNVEDNEGNQSNNSLITIQMVPQADLVVTKTDNKEKYTPGTNSVYTIVVKNNGPAVATNVVVLDDITSPILEAVTTWSAVGTGSAVPPNATGTGDITAANATIATVAAGESVTYTVTIAVPSSFTGQISNAASATSAIQDPNSANNSQTDIDTMNALAEIALTKTIVSPAPYNVGDNVTFLVNAKNNGPSDATGINVVDKLPSGYSLVSATPSSGTYNPSNGLWNLGSLTNTSSETLTVIAKINATGNYTNVAEVTKVNQLDPNGIVHGNNTPGEIDQADATIAPSERVDLVTTKTVDKSNPNQGDTIKYTLTVVNNGPSAATGVRLTDNLPVGTTYVAHVATGGTVNTYASGLWTIGNMNIGSSATLVIEAKVTAAGTTTQTPIVNTTTAANGNELDPTTVGDDLTEAITVTSSDIVTEKTVSKSNPSEGETITYSIKVTNNGPSPATAVRLTDILPIGVTYSSNNQGGDYNYGSGLWTVGDLAVGATKILNVNVTINAGSAGKTILNTTTPAKGDQSDPTTLGDDLNETIVVQNSADVALTKIVDNNSPNIGDIVTYTVTVTNKGTTLVTNLVVKDNLPAGLTFFSATPGKGVWSAPNWTIGTLLPGEKGSIVIRAVVGLDQGGNVLLNTVSNSQDQFDANTTPDDPSEAITVTGLDLGVLKTVSNATPNVGETITYTIKVTNNGISDATSVSITDRLPVGVTYVSSALTAGLYNNGSGLWTIGSLANGAIATLTINATVNAGTYGTTITNTTSAVTSDQADSNIGNNIGSVSIVPTAFIDLHLTKEVVANVTNPAVGDIITFEVRVINDGPSNATGVQVVDLVPSGYKFVNYSSSIGTYNPVTGLWNIGKVELGTPAILLVDVKVQDKGDYINCAEITNANEPDVDSTPGNGNVAEDDYACASAPPNQSVDLGIVKTILTDKVNPKVDSAISFEIQLTNNGNIDATDVVVSDLLPSGYTFVNYSSTKGVYNYLTGDWKVSKILNGETEILIVDVIVKESGTYLNCASINSLHQVDTNPANNTSCIAASPIAIIDLELAKEVDILKPYAETNVEFTITLTNKGPSKGTGVQVKDLLPSGMTYVSAAPSIGSYNEITGIWNVGTIDVEAVETLKVVAFVLPVGEYTNVAEVIAANELDVDSTPNNNKLLEDDQDAVTIEPEVSLVLSEGFTPNGDGINDVFEVQNLQVLYPNFSMEIVNRYGNVVYKYQHNGDKFKTPKWWDGYSTGRWNVSSEILPAGTYFYTIYFNNNERKPQTGWIYLKK